MSETTSKFLRNRHEILFGYDACIVYAYGGLKQNQPMIGSPEIALYCLCL